MDDILSIVKVFTSLSAPLYQDLNLKSSLPVSAMVQGEDVKKADGFRSMVDLISQPIKERIPVKPDLRGSSLPLRNRIGIKVDWFGF